MTVDTEKKTFYSLQSDFVKLTRVIMTVSLNAGTKPRECQFLGRGWKFTISISMIFHPLLRNF